MIENKINGKGTQPPAPSCARVPLPQHGGRPAHTPTYMLRLESGRELRNQTVDGLGKPCMMCPFLNIQSLLMKAPLLSHCQRLPLCPPPHSHCSLLPGHLNHPSVPSWWPTPSPSSLGPRKALIPCLSQHADLLILVSCLPASLDSQLPGVRMTSV